MFVGQRLVVKTLDQLSIYPKNSIDDIKIGSTMLKEMQRYCGQPVTITKIGKLPDRFKISKGSAWWWWSMEMFIEPSSEWFEEL